MGQEASGNAERALLQAGAIHRRDAGKHGNGALFGKALRVVGQDASVHHTMRSTNTTLNVATLSPWKGCDSDGEESGERRVQVS